MDCRKPLAEMDKAELTCAYLTADVRAAAYELLLTHREWVGFSSSFGDIYKSLCEKVVRESNQACSDVEHEIKRRLEDRRGKLSVVK